MSAGPIKQGVFATAGAWDSESLVLTEAPVDALSLAVCGLPSLAFCGSGMMPEWMPARCAFRSILLAFDADGAGDEAAAKWLAELTPFTRETVRLRPEGGKDWNELLTTHGRAWLEEQLARRGFRSNSRPVREMSVSEFASSRGYVTLGSEVLGENVYLAADNVDSSKIPGDLAVYRSRELAILFAEKPGPETLRFWHEVKTLFDVPLDTWEVENSTGTG